MREKQSVQAIRRGVRVNSKIAIKLEFIRFVAIFILRLGTIWVQIFILVQLK